MNLAIIGSGELAAEIYNLIISSDAEHEYEDIFFVDFEENQHKNIVAEKDFINYDKNSVKVIVALGEPFGRNSVGEKYSKAGFKMATFVHNKSFVSGKAIIDEGCVVFPFTYVSQNTVIGKNTILHAGSIIENDCHIGSNCFISSNSFIGAKTNIGNTCFIGPNVSVRDSLEIGSNSIIGMGSVVTKSIDSSSICYGNPARVVKENLSHKVFK